MQTSERRSRSRKSRGNMQRESMLPESVSNMSPMSWGAVALGTIGAIALVYANRKRIMDFVENLPMVEDMKGDSASDSDDDYSSSVVNESSAV